LQTTSANCNKTLSPLAINWILWMREAKIYPWRSHFSVPPEGSQRSVCDKTSSVIACLLRCQWRVMPSDSYISTYASHLSRMWLSSSSSFFVLHSSRSFHVSNRRILREILVHTNSIGSNILLLFSVTASAVPFTKLFLQFSSFRLGLYATWMVQRYVILTAVITK